MNSEEQREEDLAQEIQNLYFDAGARVDIHTWNRTKSILAKARVEWKNQMLDEIRNFDQLSGMGCRLCVYENGVFVSSCVYHKEIDRANAEYQRGYEAAERDALEVVSREKYTWARESIGWRAVDSVEKTLTTNRNNKEQP